MNAKMAMINKKHDYYLWALVCLCVISLFLFLGETLFNTRGEPREAVVALSMIQGGNWILPTNNGVDMAFKPPLFHWCIAVISSVTGKVTEYTSRMPSAMALTAMVMAGYCFYAKRRGKEIAFLAALITLTNFEVHRAGTNCRVDMLLSALMVIALYQLYKWGEKGLKGIPWTGILCLSGAFLTKGPVGMALPCLVVAVFLLLRGMKFRKVFCSFLWMALVSCILPLLWYWAAYRQGGDEFLQLVLEENVLRFLGKMTYESHENPAYYNVLMVLGGYVPYTLMVLISLFVLKYKKISGNPCGWWTHIRTRIREMDDVRLFSLLSIVIIFIFYCIPKSKRGVYLLPIYPFIAFFLAEYIIYLVRVRPVAIRIFGGVMASLSLLLLAVFAALRLGWIPETIFSGRHAEENVAFMRALETVPISAVRAFVIGLMAVTAISCFFLMRRKHLSWEHYGVMALMFTVFLSLDGLFTSTVLNVKSDKPVAGHIAEIAPEGRIYSFQPEQVEGNAMRQFTLDFYLNDRMAPFDAFFPDSGYVVIGDRNDLVFAGRYKNYRLELVYDSGHRSCDDHKVIRLYQFSRDPE